MKRYRRYLEKSWSEASRRSRGRSRLQVRNLTILVFVISFVVGLYITIADTAYDYVIRWLATLA